MRKKYKNYAILWKINILDSAMNLLTCTKKQNFAAKIILSNVLFSWSKITIINRNRKYCEYNM